MTTPTVQEIENAIVTLSANELQELYAWLDQNRPQPIDARIEAGIAAGHFDQLVTEALEDVKHGRTRPL